MNQFRCAVQSAGVAAPRACHSRGAFPEVVPTRTVHAENEVELGGWCACAHYRFGVAPHGLRTTRRGCVLFEFVAALRSPPLAPFRLAPIQISNFMCQLYGFGLFGGCDAQCRDDGCRRVFFFLVSNFGFVIMNLYRIHTIDATQVK